MKRIIEFHTKKISTDDFFYVSNFFKILENQKNLAEKLNNFMSRKNFSNLFEFLKFFASVQEREAWKRDPTEFLIRYGRICSINVPDGSSETYNWYNRGLVRFYFEFYHVTFDSPQLP